ncbi:MAG: mechanosensitive ion channel family protein [Rhizobiaceae bacterium]
MLAFPPLWRAALLLFVFIAVAFPRAADAQSVGTFGGIVAEQQTVLDDLRTRVDELERHVNASAEDDARLVEARARLEAVGRQALESALAFRPRLGEINARLDQLGQPPADDQAPEPDIVTLERQNLLAEKAEINSLVGVAENLSIRVNGLIDRIAQMRRDLFARLLTKRYVIDYALIHEVLDAAVKETAEFYRAVSSWLRFVVTFKWRSVLLAALFAVGAAAVLMIGGRRLFGRLLIQDSATLQPSYLSRLSVAFWATLLPTAALAVLLGATYYFFDYFAVLRADIRVYLASLFSVVTLFFFVHRLGRLALSPKLPAWRLIPVRDRAAWPLVLLVSATAFFTGLDDFLTNVYQVLGSPLALTVGESLVATILNGLILILIGLVKPYADADGRPRPWHPAMRLVLFALAGTMIVAALFGYIGLARFISQQVVVTGAILATMYLGLLSARAVSEEGAFQHTALGRRSQRWFGLDETTLDQLGLVAGITINVAVVLIGLPLILLQWGFRQEDLTAWTFRLANEIRIGSVSFSLAGIFSGVVVFVVGYFVTRWFQGWLDGSVMARGRVDMGVRNSIRTAVGYAGIALAGLIGISAAGIDLSNIALVAGALSLGIGFGLQNIVNNFVSGLILLAERPFKVGDWIVAGGFQGTVRKISVRATEIETFQRQTIILPNSELINAAVGNWTHRNKLGRVDIRVVVAYDSDARRAHEIMTEIVRTHPAVLRNPEPFVQFVNFGTTGAEFEVRVFLADILNGATVQNDVRFSILEAFEKDGIEVPSAPRAQTVAKETPWPLDDDRAHVEAESQAVEQTARKRADETRAKGRARRRKIDPD